MYQFLIPDRAQGHSFASNKNFGSADKQLLMPFHCCGSLMESNQWDFQFGGADSDTMTSLEANDSTCGSGSNEFGVNSDQTLQNGFFTTGASDMNSSGMTSVEGGLQGLDLQDLMGQQHTCPPMHFSSNHLLVAARFFQQKRLRRALATSSGQMPSAGNSYADDTRSILSQGTPDNAKFSLPRSDWVFGTVNESQSVGSNGSKTSSPQQVSPDSSSPAIGSLPCIGCCPYGREQVEHHSLGLQARTDFHNSMLDSFNCGSVQMKQVQDAMWPSHPQVPFGVLVPSCPNHSGGNQLLKSCEVGATKAKPRVRARRGQATDPHSIAERLRRERIADRFKSLQELVPNTNKTDRAIMLDEIIEYVKFLLTQVKLLNMSRLGSAGLILPIVSGLPEESRLQAPSEIPGDEPGTVPESMSAIEEYFARLISNNAGAALQFLQRKGLCLVPISLTDSTKLNTEAAGSQSHSLNLLN